MPTSSHGTPGEDPFEQAHLAARELARRTGHPRHDALVVLGTALSPAAALLGASGPGLDLAALPWFPRYTGPGHTTDAWSLPIGGRQVLVAAGRLHLYEGYGPHQVVHLVRTAVESGCTTVILTNAAGAIRPGLELGQVVAVADHLNLTATSPLAGFPAAHPAGSPFVSMVDAWSPRLRALVRQLEPGLAEGVYAQVGGPQFETPAEIRMLASLGADMVGMSTVPEAIAARHLGAELLGLSVITNQAAGRAGGAHSLEEIGAAARRATHTVARLVRGVVAEGEASP